MQNQWLENDKLYPTMWNSVLSFLYILFVSSLLKPHLSLALPFHIPEKELKHVFQTDHTDYLIYQNH